MIHRLFNQSKNYITVLRLTALLLIFYPPHNYGGYGGALIKFILPILGSSMLIFPSLLVNRIMWLAILFIVAGNNIKFWFLFINHKYLTTYWYLTCAIGVSFKKDIEQILAWNAKLLIGLCFLCATIWKFLPGEYLNGSFFEATFLLDTRFEQEAILFGGLSSDILSTNRDLLLSIQNPQGSMEKFLVSSQSLELWSRILSYWTIFIELAIAIAFLFPKPSFLSKNRDWLLLIFIITTYSAAPVPAFAAILMIMGYASTSKDQLKVQTVYLLLYIFLPIWLKIPNQLFR